MPEITLTHWLCERELTVEVAEDYDLSRGLAVSCPTCRDTFWHFPRPRLQPSADGGAQALRAAPVTIGASAAAGGEVIPLRPGDERDRAAALMTAEGGDPDLPATPPGTAAGYADELTTLRSGIFTPEPPARRRLRRSGGTPWWLGPVLVVLGIVAIIIAVTQRQPVTTAAPPEPVPAQREPADATAAQRAEDRAAARDRAAAQRERDRRAAAAAGRTDVAFRRATFTTVRPRGWESFADGTGIALAPSRGAATRVTIYSEPRSTLTVTQLAELGARTLRSQLPGASVSAPRAITIAGRPGRELRAVRGSATRIMRVTVSGSSVRSVVILRSGATSSAVERAAAQRVLLAFRPR